MKDTMDQNTQAVATPDAAAPAAKPTPPKRVAAVLSLIDPDGVILKAIKYPMPLKAPRFSMTVNGDKVSAAQTTFKLIKYTYFEYKGASFYVPGHLDQLLEYTFKHSEGYDFAPTKLDRKAQAAAAATSAAAKKAAAPSQAGAGPVQAAAASNATTEGGSPVVVAEPVQAAKVEAPKGKSFKR